MADGADEDDGMMTLGQAPGERQLRHARLRRLVPLLGLVIASGCMMIGPDYQTPPTPVNEGWVSSDDGVIAPGADPIGPWWETFGDPVLTSLIVEAYEANPTLQAAGVRVLEAQARRGIAIGTIFPQTQQLSGGYQRVVASKNTSVPVFDRGFNDFMLGFDVAWELDLWGG